jgi:hypothetical protein
VAVGADGAIYVTGGTTTFGDSLFILKFAPDGTLVWQRVWGPATGDGVAVAPDGSIYVAGTGPRPDGAPGAAVVLLKIDPAGILIWQRAYSTAEIADARGGVAVAPDGSVYVAGAVQESARKRWHRPFRGGGHGAERDDFAGCDHRRSALLLPARADQDLEVEGHAGDADGAASGGRGNGGGSRRYGGHAAGDVARRRRIRRCARQGGALASEGIVRGRRRACPSSSRPGEDLVGDGVAS